MDFSKLNIYFLLLQLIFIFSSIVQADLNRPSKLFREYIGAEGKNVKFSDVPINSNVEFHFILSFAIDYTNSSTPLPSNGQFNIFWDTDNLTPSAVSDIKAKHPNVKVAMSLAGDSVGNKTFVYFNPKSIHSWVINAINSITNIVREYNLDGIDIDYEHFMADPETFTECIGKLLHHLKSHRIVSFISIAPFERDDVQAHYLALWEKYGHLIDYVNFQFYAYPNSTTIPQFLQYFETQSLNYKGGKVLVSLVTSHSRGLSPKNGFFNASSYLKSEGKLQGIFIWCADDSKKDNFYDEILSQDLLSV